ncbi:MAG: hypothetical protein IB617_02620 [Candidatus Nealsonbacteria bacterium]|nr:MAG: hypothetical protein IB617_02620 [Candidatus Nealsonbacteria bacterium]
MPDNEKKIKKSLPEYWADFLLEEFSKETDRAAMILTASLIENTLTTLLKNYLVQVSTKDDELFDGPTAPLSNFNSKVQFAHRLGLISQKLAHDLHIIRKIRNDFAHNVYGSNLESGVVKDLLTTLIYSSDIVRNLQEARSIYPEGARGDFLTIASIMLFYLNQEIEKISKKQVKPMPIEWIYSWVYKKKKPSAATQPPQPTKDEPTETRSETPPKSP